jgi:hypothetical protein
MVQVAICGPHEEITAIILRDLKQAKLEVHIWIA